MRSRFLYCLSASVIFHLLVFILPFSDTMGGLGRKGMRPVRVHLLSGGDESPGEEAGKARSTAEARPAAAKARELSRSPHASPDQSNEGENEPNVEQVSEASSRTEENREKMRPVRRVKRGLPKRAPAPDATAIVRRNHKPANQEALSARKSTNSDHMPRAIPKAQKVLRTTTVYTGSRSAAPAQRRKGNAANDAGNKPPLTGAATGSEHQDGSQQVQSGRVSQVRYAKVVKPNYPDEARTKGWEGTTVLRVLVNRAGKSEEIEVHRSSGFNLLDHAAVEALWLWQFYPARIGSKEIQSWVNVPVVFNLKEED